MTLQPDCILRVLGYLIDDKGNIKTNENQLAVVTLEDTGDGGLLRIHGNSNSFFYEGDAFQQKLNLHHPLKISKKYIYFFDGTETSYKIKRNEFAESLMQAMSEYNVVVSKKDLRG